MQQVSDCLANIDLGLRNINFGILPMKSLFSIQSYVAEKKKSPLKQILVGNTNFFPIK